MTSWDDLRLQVAPGSGVVAKSAAALLVVPTVTEHQHTVLAQLIDAVRGARPGGGRVLARKLAALIAGSEPEDVPDLALVAALGEDLAVLVLGDVEVSAQTAEGSVTLSGHESLTWVDRVLRAPTGLTVGVPGSPAPTPTPFGDLAQGVVSGGGAVLERRTGGSAWPAAAVAAPAPVPAPEPAPVAVAPAPVTPASVDEVAEAAPPRIDTRKPSSSPATPPLPPPPTDVSTEAMPATPDDFEVESLSADEPEPREPLPVEPEHAPESEVAHTDLVEGVYCKRGHFTDPDGQFCIVCGIGLYETKIKRKGVRPELGFLVFDDGSVFHLDHDYVLGRQPEVDDDVKAGTVRGLRLEDSGGTVSRAHAIVRLIGWNVTIADRRSQNGTLVAAKDSDQFVPVSREQPVTLIPGSRIQLGQRTLVYESQRGRS